jgi:CheY-like chemotaxis protein
MTSTWEWVSVIWLPFTVHDFDLWLQLLIALMNKLKLDFDCAVNGLEALEKYEAFPSRYFLVLTDMNMPVRSVLLLHSGLLH